MGYVENNLMKDEKVIYKAKVHWMVFLWPVITALIGIWLIVLGVTNNDETIGVWGTLIFVFLPLPMGLSALVYSLTTEFAVTNKRIIAKTGLIRRKSVDLMLSKLESVQVDQGLLERILGAGTVTVRGTGGSKEPFTRIAKPLELRREVQSQQS